MNITKTDQLLLDFVMLYGVDGEITWEEADKLGFHNPEYTFLTNAVRVDTGTYILKNKLRLTTQALDRLKETQNDSNNN